MVETEKEQGFFDIILKSFSSIPQMISLNLFHPIAEGVEMVIDRIEIKLSMIENMMLRKIHSFLILVIGEIFLVLGIFSFLREYLRWNSTVSFFSIGLVIIIIGLMLRTRE